MANELVKLIFALIWTGIALATLVMVSNNEKVEQEIRRKDRQQRNIERMEASAATQQAWYGLYLDTCKGYEERIASLESENALLRKQNDRYEYICRHAKIVKIDKTND